jgi:hypothetical protein
MPVFQVLKTELPHSLEQQKTYKLYEFSYSNMNKFVEKLNTSIEKLIPSVNFLNLLSYLNGHLTAHASLPNQSKGD